MAKALPSPLGCLHADQAEIRRLRAALEQIAATKNTQNPCVRHGGVMGADDPETCWCSVSLDAAEKMRAIAREALNA